MGLACDVLRVRAVRLDSRGAEGGVSFLQQGSTHAGPDMGRSAAKCRSGGPDPDRVTGSGQWNLARSKNRSSVSFLQQFLHDLSCQADGEPARADNM